MNRLGEQRHSRGRRRPRADLAAALFAALVLAVTPAAPADDSALEVRVRYRSADTVYLDAGISAGIAVGERWIVSRKAIPLGEIEVTYVARSSASCRVIRSTGEMRAGDLATRLDAEVGTQDELLAPGGPVPPAGDPDAGTAPSEQTTPSYRGVTGERSPSSTHRGTRISGSVALDWESAAAADESAYDYVRTNARLDLRVREIGGGPYEFRARLRRREIDRDRLLDDLPSESETRDRFYELSFTYEPPEGRYSYAVGRLGAGSSVLGYLDGVRGRFALSDAFHLGGFVGSRPDLGELSFGTAELKYGLFGEYAPPRTGRGSLAILLAGVREEGELDVSREYVALQTRYETGERWSFYERAEIDLNNGWRREASSSAVQLSSLSLGVTARLSEHGRLSVSYDRYERYRTEETRFISEEIFDDLLRQGLRVRVAIGRPRRPTVALFAGYRERDDDHDSTSSFGLGLSDSEITRWKLGLNLTLLGFSNHFSEGGVVTLRARKRIRGGHELNLTLGDRLSTDRLFDEERSTSWLRIGGWVELPANLFATLGYEISSGDDGDGEITLLSLGYRF